MVRVRGHGESSGSGRGSRPQDSGGRAPATCSGSAVKRWSVRNLGEEGRLGGEGGLGERVGWGERVGQ